MGLLELYDEYVERRILDLIRRYNLTRPQAKFVVEASLTIEEALVESVRRNWEK